MMAQEFGNSLADLNSKSQRKREMTALQKLGEILITLPPHQLAGMSLDPILADAILIAQTITRHEAKRRQLQYIGKLMRHVDVQPIEEAVSKFHCQSQRAKAQFHYIELWRDKLIAGGDAVLCEFINTFGDVDKQYVRQLLRKIVSTQEGPKPSPAAQELFRYLRTLVAKE